jgi:hypothetical protein
MKSILSATLLAFGLLQGNSLIAQSQITFDHLNAGAVGTDFGDQLIWANAGTFSTNAGYFAMPFSSAGTYAGYYNSSPTLTVLPATTDNGGPVSLAPALGSYIQAQIFLVSAPEGGQFSFWLTGATEPSYVLNPGDSTALVNLSSSDGSFGSDPYGHIHGRRFGATVLGDYIVGLQLFDTSDNGLDGLPIHTPSDILYMDFRATAAATPEPGTAALMGLGLIGFGLWTVKRNRASGN